MTWLKIDDAFEDHAKVAPLSDAAHRLWMRAACWCKKPQNLHTNGFVPLALLPTIARLPLRKAKKLAQELVDAKGGGIFQQGLWEAEEGGWRFHDWAKYQPDEGPPPSESTPVAKSEAGRLGGLRSAEVRRAKNGTAQPKQTEAPPRSSPKQTPEAPPKHTSNQDPKQGPKQTSEAGRSTPEAPDPVPDPDPDLSGEAAAEDLTASAHDGAQRQQRQEIPGRKVRCPVPVPVDDDTLTNLDLGLGIPRDVALAALAEWSVAQASNASDVRAVEIWVKCAVRAVSGDWSDPAKRKRMLAAVVEQPKRDPDPAEQERLAAPLAAHRERARREAEDALAKAPAGNQEPRQAIGDFTRGFER